MCSMRMLGVTKVINQRDIPVVYKLEINVGSIYA